MAYFEDGTRASGRPRDGSVAAAPGARVAREPLSAASRSARQAIDRCPELDCIRHRLAPGTLSRVEARAIRGGTGADQVVLAAGLMSEEQYVRAFAASLRLRFEQLDHLPRRLCPVPDERLARAAARGFLPLTLRCGRAWVIAPRGLTARRLIALVRSRPELRERVVVTTKPDLRRFAARHGALALSRQAADALRRQNPLFSAAPRRWRPGTAFLGAAALVAACTAAVPAAMLIALQLALTGVFLGWTGLRLLAAARAPPPAPPAARLPDELLPLYTVIVALYREAAVVPNLIRALEALDYPAEKLDIKLVLEADDPGTRAAIEGMGLAAPFEIIVAPQAGPRTKPKALNAALPFARGAFTVVYDAEDRPEADQLRQALNAFLTAPEGLACVQAALTIDNTRDGWLARLFTAEYAGQFDVFLPGLAALRLPIPLGGSSNHFPTEVLREIGAWDPYNVTEDADLGTRLARFGYRTATIGSTTHEEAAAQLTPWLKQRTRWFKGWMQTWLVHMRQPWRLARELGPAGFASFQLVVAGTVLAALIQPVIIVWLMAAMLTGRPILSGGHTLLAAVVLWVHGGTLVGGYLTSGVLAFMGLKRRRLLWCAWTLVLLPVHCGLLSIAAWRALLQLVLDPYGWEKTPHGLARTSRRSQQTERPPGGPGRAAEAGARSGPARAG